MVDPRISFGQPLMLPTGIRTETVVDRFLAGEGIETIAEEYTLTREAIEQALRFENRLGLIAAGDRAVRLFVDRDVGPSLALALRAVGIQVQLYCERYSSDPRSGRPLDR